MAERKSMPGDLAGFAVPRDQTVLWEAQTTATEASPVAQRGTASRTPGMTLQGSGTPENSDDLELLAVRGGLAVENSAAFLWRANAGAYHGWEAPNAVDRMRFLSDAGTWRHPTMVANGDGTIVAAIDDIDFAARTRDLRVTVRSAAGVWPVPVSVYQLDNFFAYGLPFHSSLIRLPNGTLELYHLTYEIKDPNAVPPFDFWMQLRKMVSDDGGQTWALAQVSCIDNRILVPSGQTVSSASVSYGNGQHLFCFTLEPAGNLYTYASRDGGSTFERVGLQTALTYQVETAFDDGYFVIAIAPKRFSGAGPWPTTPLIGRTGDPFREVTDWEYLTEQAANSAAGDYLAGLALIPSEIGLLVTWGNAPYGVEHYLLRSIDGGANWSAYYDVTNDAERAAIWWRSVGPLDATYTAATGIGPTDYCGVWHRGALLMLTIAIDGNADPALGTEIYDLVEMQLGGYSTQTRPLGAGGQGLTSSLYTVSWFAWDQPHIASAWNTSHTGVPTVSLATPGEMNVQCAAGVVASWVHGTTSAGRTTQIGTMVAETTLGSCRLRLRGSSNGVWYDVSASLTPASVSLFDEVGAATLATAAISAATRYEVRLGVDWSQPSAALWFREKTTDGEAREWTYVGTGTPTASGFSLITSAEIQVSATAGSAEADIEYVAVNAELETTLLTTSGTVQEVTPAAWGDAQTTTEMSGRPFSSDPVYVHDGVSVRAFGLARGGDTWSVLPTADFKTEHVQPLVYPSPRRTHRTLTTAAGQYLAWQLDPNGQDRRDPSQVICVHLQGINYGEALISRRTGGSWAAAVTVPLWRIDGGGYERYGTTIVPSNAVTVRTFLQEDELAGGFLKFSNGTLRRIVSNTAGTWYTSATERRASITIQGDGTEPTSGTVQVMATAATVMLHTRGDYDTEAIRLEMSEPGPDGYFETGVAVVEGVTVLGDETDTTRTRNLLQEDEVNETTDGVRRQLAVKPQRRRWEVSWVQRTFRALSQGEVPTDGLPYVQASEDASALPAATYHNAPLDVYGVLKRHKRRPLVWIPKIPQDDGTGTGVFVRSGSEAGLYGRVMTETLRLESAGWMPDTCDEQLRLATLAIEEEL